MAEKITGQIVMGPRFFHQDVKRYTNPALAWVREMAQNSIDAGSTSIYITVQPNPDGRGCEIKWTDNGCGMTLDIIRNALLVIGESHKALGGTGGFGVAGCLLYFAMLSYTILTKMHIVTGTGGQFEIEELPMEMEGTTAIVKCHSDVRGSWFAADMERNIKTWFLQSKFDGTVTLNGDVIPTWRAKRIKKTILKDWCAINIMKEDGHVRNVVRINGQAMFEVTAPSNQKSSIYIELTGEDSSEFVNQSRDGMAWEYRDKLDTFLTEISRDPRAVTKQDSDLEIRKGRLGTMNPEMATKDGRERMQNRLIANPEAMAEMLAEMSRATQAGAWSGHNMAISNSTSCGTPNRWRPDNEKMGKHERDLMQMWNHVCMIIASILKFDEKFSTGWTISLEADATHVMRCGVHYICLNPVNISDKGRMTNRYGTLSTEDFNKMVELAIHEFTHGQGFSWHGEEFIMQMGKNFVKVMGMWDVVQAVRKDLSRARRGN